MRSLDVPESELVALVLAFTEKIEVRSFRLSSGGIAEKSSLADMRSSGLFLALISRTSKRLR